MKWFEKPNRFTFPARKTRYFAKILIETRDPFPSERVAAYSVACSAVGWDLALESSGCTRNLSPTFKTVKNPLEITRECLGVTWCTLNCPQRFLRQITLIWRFQAENLRPRLFIEEYSDNEIENMGDSGPNPFVQNLFHDIFHAQNFLFHSQIDSGDFVVEYFGFCADCQFSSVSPRTDFRKNILGEKEKIWAWKNTSRSSVFNRISIQLANVCISLSLSSYKSCRFLINFWFLGPWARWDRWTRYLLGGSTPSRGSRSIGRSRNAFCTLLINPSRPYDACRNHRRRISASRKVIFEWDGFAKILVAESADHDLHKSVNKIEHMKLANSFGMKVICLEPNKSADSA